MPSYLHEGVLELFRADLTLAATLIADVCDVPVPGYTGATTEQCDFSDIGPKEFRGDLALSLHDADGVAVLGICVEVQLSEKPHKQWSWPVYLTTLRARLRCPVVLLVVVPNTRVAAWAGAPIDIGHPGFALRPLVVGPDRVPLVTDPMEAASSPERAVLSAMAHGNGPHSDEVFTALLVGLTKTDDERARMYHDLVDEVLSEAASRRLEELMTMTYEYQGRIARKYVEQGRQEAREETTAANILTILRTRRIAVSDAQRARIEGCRDLAQLDTWLTRAIDAATTADILD
ncbi:hypothetical protein [Nocardia sp. NPDC050718]|uniref:hypothetical protein n=1 Tax=Nocardia sp. NPDC050718 TaxID=3155788 RepID=UPI0033CA8563